LPIELNTKKCLTHPFTWRRRWDKCLKTTINKGIATRNLTPKKSHPSSLFEKMNGAINYKKFNMSLISISTWGSTLSCFGIIVVVIVVCSFIMSIVFYNSTSILLTSTIDVAQTSTWASPCSSLFSFKACPSCPIIHVSAFPKVC
jgi:hypothetical protein